MKEMGEWNIIYSQGIEWYCYYVEFFLEHKAGTLSSTVMSALDVIL